MTVALNVFTILMVSLGCLFFFAGMVGLLRFPDTLSRLHALTKADNLGLGFIVLGLLAKTVWSLSALKMIALWLFALLGSAVVAQLIGFSVRPRDWRTKVFFIAPTKEDP